MFDVGRVVNAQLTVCDHAIHAVHSVVHTGSAR